MLERIGEARARLQTLIEAELFQGGSLRGLVRLWKNLLTGDVHLSTIWALNAANFPNKEAVVDGERRVSWSELESRINRAAHALLALGVTPGDRVAVQLRNSLEWVECFAGCGKIGAAAVLASYRSTAAELEYLLADSGALAVVFGAELEDQVRGASAAVGLDRSALLEVGGTRDGHFPSYAEAKSRAAEVEPPRPRRRDGARVLVYTSGTTGRPKGAVRELARSGLGPLLDLLRVVPLRRSDRHLVAAPLYHATGSGFALIHASLGSTLHLMPSFDPREFLHLVRREKITTTAVVPTMLQSILALPEEERRGADVSSLRVIICTGARLSEAAREEAREFFGDVVYDLYGATEMGWVTVATPADQKAKPASVGKPVPGTDVVLLSREREPVPDGETGELFARNPLTFEGYHGNPEATDESRWGEYVSVGDLAVRDQEGYVTLVDRKSDMVISGGVNIYPAEIEQVLEAHPEIAQAAVIGVPDEHWGESLVAFLVPRPDATVSEEDVTAHCRRHLSGYKVPRRFRFVAELPRNPTGKVLKKELRRSVS